MSKSNAYETDILGLLFNATPIALVADDTATTPLTNLYLALHSSDPGEAGTQTTNEVAYTSYARVAVARSNAGFTVSGNSVVLAADVDFPECTGSTATATHFSVGSLASGAGKIFYSGTVTPNISISTGVTPRLTTGTTITED